MSKKFVIIDGNSLLHRAFYALPPLRTSKGVYTNAVYGFVNMLLKLKDDLSPDYLSVVFDKKGPTFRHEEYKGYKANRDKMPDQLSPQFQILKDVLSAFKIEQFEKEGYEADDLFGTLAKQNIQTKDIESIIVTGDKDALQLVSSKINVMLTKKGISEMELYNEDKIKEKYGVNPEKIIDIKGLMGDSSDNIPGVPGIGEKTAIKLIKEFDSLENLLENIEQVKAKKLKENLELYYENALLSKHLVTIKTDVDLSYSINDCKIKEGDKNELLNLFKELEFTGLLKKLNLYDDFDRNEDIEIIVLNKSKFSNTIERIKESNYLCFTIESDESNPMVSSFLGIYFAYNENEIFYVEKGNLPYFIKELKILLEDEKIQKNCYNAKESYIELKKEYGIELNGLRFDPMIAAYLLDSTKSNYNLDNIVNEFLGYTIKSLPAVKTNSIFKLEEIMFKKLKENNLTSLFTNIELPMIKILAEMQINGFKIDTDELKKISKLFNSTLNRLTLEIYDIAGCNFNINSPKQLGDILFKRIGLPVIKKTKTGFSTNAEVLEKLKNEHRIVEKILEYRTIMKLKTTYVDGLLNLVNKETGKIHSTFNQTITSTGRISSTEPNLQNIPIRFDIGRKIRKAFVPEDKDRILLAADYSQIELRIMAHVSEDPKLIDAFLNNEDIHTRTASEVFGVSLNEVTAELRNKAKAVNFGIVYGISDYGLSEDLGISIKMAKEYIDEYFAKYVGVRDYIRETIKKAKTEGYVTTIFNRKRHLPDINNRNYNIRSFAERTAVNTPIQGSAADIIKISMININKLLKDKDLKGKMILQVHDELIFDIPKYELDSFKELIKNEMEEAVTLKVPTKVDLKSGPNWYEMNKIT